MILNKENLQFETPKKGLKVKNGKAKRKKDPVTINSWRANAIVSIISLSILYFCIYTVSLLPWISKGSKVYWLLVATLFILIFTNVVKWFLVKIPYLNAMVLYDDILNTVRVIHQGLHTRLPWENSVTEEDNEGLTINLKRERVLENEKDEEYRTKNGRWIKVNWILHLTPHKHYLISFVKHNLDGAIPVFRGRINKFMWAYVSEHDDTELMGKATKAGELSKFQEAFKKVFNGDDIDDPNCTDSEEAEYGVWTGTPILSGIMLSEDAQAADELQTEAQKTLEAIETYKQMGVSPDVALAVTASQLNPDAVNYSHIGITGLEKAQNVSFMYPEVRKGESKQKNKKGKGK